MAMVHTGDVNPTVNPYIVLPVVDACHWICWAVGPSLEVLLLSRGTRCCAQVFHTNIQADLSFIRKMNPIAHANASQPDIAIACPRLPAAGPGTGTVS